MNVLLSEYGELLAKAAAKWGADNDEYSAKNNEARWTCPMGSLSVVVCLCAAHDSGDGFEPTVRIGQSSAPHREPQIARLQLSSGIATIDKAVSGYAELADVLVWYDKCPCDRCSGRGTDRYKQPCEHCAGRGYRTETDK